MIICTVEHWRVSSEHPGAMNRPSCNADLIQIDSLGQCSVTLAGYTRTRYLSYSELFTAEGGFDDIIPTNGEVCHSMVALADEGAAQ